MTTESNPLAHICLPMDYRTAGRSHLFPSDASLKWFLRFNRAALIDSGAVLKIAGRLVIDAPKMDKAVLRAGHDAIREAGTS
jgi:hypothetical protein